MKLKHKIFKALNYEPAIVQELDGKKLEIYWMNDTPYFAQFAGQGRFSIWTSDGKNYKLLIEKGYYEIIKELYSPVTSSLWINYLDSVGKTQFRFNLIFFGASILIVVGVIIAAILSGQQYIALIGLAVVMIMSMVQNGILRNKIRKSGDELQFKLMESVGNERFNQLIAQQNAYFDEFFKNLTKDSDDNNDASDEVIEENIADEENLVIEHKDEQEKEE